MSIPQFKYYGDTYRLLGSQARVISVAYYLSSRHDLETFSRPVTKTSTPSCCHKCKLEKKKKNRWQFGELMDCVLNAQKYGTMRTFSLLQKYIVQNMLFSYY